MSLQSARVKILDAGAVVASDKETHLEDGRLRIHICAPVEGWLSAKTVVACEAPECPPVAETPLLRQDPSALLPGEASAAKRRGTIQKAGARVRLFALYGVADNSHNLIDWVWHAPPWLEVRLLELAGHGQRIKEPLPPYSARDASASAADVVQTFRGHRRALAEEIADDLEAFLGEPYALYGFSMGAIVLYEVCLVLQERAAPPPLRLFASGRGAPHSCSCGARDFALLATGDDDFVLEWMRDRLGFNTDAFPKTLRERAGRLFRMGMLLGVHAGTTTSDPDMFWGTPADAATSDMALARDPPKLDVPVTAIGSAADHIWPPLTVDKWAHCAPEATYRRVVVPGGAKHNEVMNHKETMAAVFADLEAAVALPPPGET